MVSSVTNSVNYLVAATFSDVARANAVGNPKAASALDALKRITPELPGQQVDQVGQQSQQGGRSGQQGRFGAFDERQPSLSDYVRPKLALAPSEEMALFATDLANQATPVAAPIQPPQIQARQASFLEDTVAEEQVQEQASRRKQSYVANLYAQTGDIAFSGDRFVNQAA